MRPRRTTSPLLPVNSKHLKLKPGGSQCLRLTLLCIILFVLGYAFVSRSQSSVHVQTGLDVQLSPERKLSIKEQMEHRSLSGEVITTSPDPQLLHEDTHAAAHHLNDLLASPHGAEEHERVHFQRPHRDHPSHQHNKGHHGQHAEHEHPDATHQVAGRQAQPTGIPDASHQVVDQQADKNAHFPDAAHQVVEAATGGDKKPLDDVKFIHHEKWDEKDVKAPGSHTSTPTTTTSTTTTTTTTKEEAPVVAPPPATGTGLYALAALDIDGNIRQLREFQGKVALVVNVASACGFTDANYKGLQALYNKYSSRGFVVLGFPCNQFGEQESGSLAEIKSFCTGRYHVTFPMFSKVDVNGPSTHPVYQFLRRELPESEGGGGGHGEGKAITWNFNKFLVDPKGKPIRYYDSVGAPFVQDVLERDIETLLLQVPKL